MSSTISVELFLNQVTRLFFPNYITRANEISRAQQRDGCLLVIRVLGISLSVFGYFEHVIHEKHRNSHAEKNSDL